MSVKDWQRIRVERTDLTDYVIHFTKSQVVRTAEGIPYKFQNAIDVLFSILECGVIRPTFAQIVSKVYGTTSNTVRGPHPAVCFTEQPIAAVLKSSICSGNRYSGCGIAFHKYALFQSGGRPVIYGCPSMLGKGIAKGEVGYEDGKEIYRDGLPLAAQYLFVRYQPTLAAIGDYPVDWTWEREWRYCCRGAGLPICLEKQSGFFSAETPVGAIVVETDAQVARVASVLDAHESAGATWPKLLKRIVSLETARRMLPTDERYGRIETWPSALA